MRSFHPRSRRRTGFTLVELMVSAAICILIMAILATAFQMGMDTMRHMMSHMNLADQERAAAEVIRRDLGADHFLPDDARPNQGRRVSDYRLELGAAPPKAGFFRVLSPGGQNDSSGQPDAYGLYSTRADYTSTPLLHFTSILPGGADQNTYSATMTFMNTMLIPPRPDTRNYTSRAAEIAYFLDPIAFVVDPSQPVAAQVRLHNLIRRQRLVAVSTADKQSLVNPDGSTDPSVISATGSPGASVAPPPYTSPPYISGGGAINTLADLTNMQLRLGGAGAMPPNPAVPPAVANDNTLNALATRPGDDILLSNVISFEVKVLWSDSARTVGALDFFQPSPPAPTPYSVIQNSDHPFGYLNGEFDTRSAPNVAPAPGNPGFVSPPSAIRVKALQIRIRVWDPKLQNARQITVVQEM